MKEKNTNSKNPYRVEATSVHDLEGCATTEVTGLIPTPPETHAQSDSYKQIFPYSPDCYVEKQGSRK